MRRVTMQTATILLGVWASVAAAQTGPVRISRAEFSRAVRGQKLVLGYVLVAANRGGAVGVKLDLERDEGGGRRTVVTVIPTEPDGSPSIIELKKGQEVSGILSFPLVPGTYQSFRFRLLDAPDGKTIRPDRVVYDSVADPGMGRIGLGVTIAGPSGGARAGGSKPAILPPDPPSLEANADGTWNATAIVKVRIPDGAAVDAGYRIVASGNAGVQEQPVRALEARAGGAEGLFGAVFVFRSLIPGLYSAELTLHDAAGARLQVLQGAFDFEVGGPGWVRKAPLERLPPRLRVRNRRWETVSGAPYDFFADNPVAGSVARFVRGGNFGNAICWTVTPALNTPQYFAKLRGIGCRFMRLNFDAERYPDDDRYRRAVDQIVQNILSAGMFPIINPQSLPKGSDRAEQVRRGQRVVEAMAREYRGMPVWISICNEPHQFGTWAEWKPVAVRYVRAVRAIDPDAFVIVPFEGLSKDGRSAALDPITETLVDLYDGHAYVQPDELEKLFGPAMRAGLPVLLGEYGGGAGYLARMHAAMEKLPGLMAVAPWAFTRYGMDAMPLIENGDGPILRFTASGQDVANAFGAWEQGRSVRIGR